jgi:hypothetical protein
MWKITAIDDGADTVTIIDSEGNGGSPSAAGSTQATLSRWYTTMQAWEDARDGDLVARDAVEKGELYNDSTFTGTIDIDDSTTDSTRYMWLTVAPSDRHIGVAGTGVVIDPTGTGYPMTLRDDYTHVEWLEITGWTGIANGTAGIRIDNASNVSVNHVILHDNPDPTYNNSCFTVGTSGGATVRNSLMYNCDRRGIEGAGDTLSVYNCTVYGSVEGGIVQTAGTMIAKNNLSMNNISDYQGTMDAASDYNMSSNGTARGSDLDSGTTDASGNSGVTVVDAGQNFNTTVKPDVDAGIPVWFNNDTVSKSSRVASVDSDTQLTLTDAGVTGDSDAFSLNHSTYYQIAANEFVSLTSGSENFHLKDGANAINAGVDPSAGFSDDIDGDTRPVGVRWDVGADEAPASFGGGTVTNTYTIGTATLNVNITGVTGGPVFWIVQLAAADLSGVAVNDELTDEASTAKSWKITAIDDGADTVTVIDSEGNGGSPSAAGSTQATLSRWYTTMQAWEDARDGDLVARDAVEKGEMYKDSVFSGQINIDGSTTDATRYMWLTVAPGERHNGTAGTGAKIDPTGDIDWLGAINIKDPYTKIEWLEITGFTGIEARGVQIDGTFDGTNKGENTTINQLLIHDYPDASNDTRGIAVINGSVAVNTITNTIIYGGDTTGILVSGSNTAASVTNVTLNNAGSRGIYVGTSGTVTATNTVSVNHSAADYGTTGTGVYDAASDYNMSSDGTAPGTDLDSGTTDASGNTGVTVVDAGQNFNTTVKPDVDAGEPVWFNNDTDSASSRVVAVVNGTTLTLAEPGVTGDSKAFSVNTSAYYLTAADQFMSLTSGAEDFHLRRTADAIDAGTDLSGTFTLDIDGQVRPFGDAWDVGADERRHRAGRGASGATNPSVY